MFEQLLEAIALGLDRRGIPYMVVGGQAVLLYGEPRLTRDIDITLGVGPERLAEIEGLASSFGWRILVPSPQEFVTKSLVLPCEDPASGIRIDFIFSFSAYERQALERARSIEIGKAKVQYASIEDLMIHKVVAGRPRDLEDIRNILLKCPKFDSPYVLRWLTEFDRTLSKSYSCEFENLRASIPTQSESPNPQ